MSDGVIGNTSDSGSEESRFEPWSDNNTKPNFFKQGWVFLLIKAQASDYMLILSNNENKVILVEGILFVRFLNQKK